MLEFEWRCVCVSGHLDSSFVMVRNRCLTLGKRKYIFWVVLGPCLGQSPRLRPRTSQNIYFLPSRSEITILPALSISC